MKLLMALLVVGFLSTDESAHSQDKKYWIFFRDKEIDKPSELNLSKRTLQRRLKATSPVSDDYDIPVSRSYIEKIRAMNVSVHHQSRWLNAVSVNMNDEQRSAVMQLPFVKAVRTVARALKNKTAKISRAVNRGSSVAVPDYGFSLVQNKMINTVAAHQMGYSGVGVVIGMMDTGFNLDHKALRYIHVSGQYDFVDQDTIVSEGIPGDKQRHSHGTQVLSAIAAYDNGNSIGTAFGASYLLARTENDDGIGQKAEEDQWIAGLEWLEQQGADIVSSSISFFDDFQNASDNYHLSDLDGSTALTTIATAIAFDKGVLVLNSAGNMGDRGPKYLGTPSDGKKMIAVGAVYSDSTVTDFSSRGPTADGRKKPDLAALGSSVAVVDAGDTSAYSFEAGTSLSAPLVAGLAALVLEAHPAWSARQLYNAIRKTSSRGSHPDNLIGYGIPDAVKAINYLSYNHSNIQIQDISNFPNPGSETISIQFRSLLTAAFSIQIYNALGQLVATLAKNEPAVINQTIRKVWSGRNDQGMKVSSGVYFYQITMAGESITQKILLVK